MDFMEQLQQELSHKDLERLQTFLMQMDPERRAAMMRFLAHRESQAPAVGDRAPDFELPRIEDSRARVRLSSFHGVKPVALIFGSFT